VELVTFVRPIMLSVNSLLYNVETVEPVYELQKRPEAVFVDLLRRPGIDSQPGGPVRNLFVVLARQAT
jgi:hypothetical protein